MVRNSHCKLMSLETEPTQGLSKDRLEEVVQAISKALSSSTLRQLSQRAIQARIWHQEPVVSSYMSDLRHDEEILRGRIMKRISYLIGEFHPFTFSLSDGVGGDTAMADRSSNQSLDVVCLECKERLYLVLKQYEWLSDFFRNYPQHFYENSFQFVERIPSKELKLQAKVIGLGVSGALAVSGLAKAGIQVTGFEKRSRTGLKRATIRYQNTSWRAYDVAEKLLDREAFEHLLRFRQKINIKNRDGSEKVVTSDRTQVILGEAIETFYKSAERYGATLRFDSTIEDYYYEESNSHISPKFNAIDDSDIIGIFAGVHTADLFPQLKASLNVIEWPDLESNCITWLRLAESQHTEAYCTRGGEIGAEKWHFEIFSSRDDLQDLLRVRDSLENKFAFDIKNLSNAHVPEIAATRQKEITQKYQSQMRRIDTITSKMEKGEILRYDYIFVNAPDNKHNRTKQEMEGKDGSIVLEGGYTVPVKIATSSTMSDHATSSALLHNLRTDLVVTGGDACVPPNPQAAYGASLACIFADMFVNLAVIRAHLNTIESELTALTSREESSIDLDWTACVEELKVLFVEYYDARGRTENFFQFVQTLICNLYSLPPKF